MLPEPRGQPGEVERERAAALLAGQNRALELLAQNAPLSEVLDFLTRLIEEEAPGIVCSVLLLKDGCLYFGAAPSLPDVYNKAIHGAPIGPVAGSCGTAAYTGESVVVRDIATDPLWAAYKHLALPHGLRACWSTPIRSSSGEVLGTFALYYGAPSTPPPEHLRLVELATHLAGVAIERRRQDEALAEKNRRLVEIDRRKDEFLALLAHELRNPLAPIMTAVERLRSPPPKAPDAVDRSCAVIERQVHVLRRLVDDLLDLSRVTRGTVTLQRERITAADAVARAIEASRPQLDLRGHHVRVVVPEAPIPLDADPVRLAQVLSNLLNNAAKYTPAGGHVEISAAREGSEVVFSVRDDGAGISPDMLGRIFDLFVQADGAREQAPGGLGIGLTLVKSLVELHGGRVRAESEGPGKGTTVVVRLPVADREGPGSAPTPRAATPARPGAEASPAAQPARPPVGRVLLVDDNTDAAEMLADALRDEGTEVAVAHDGPSALEEAGAHRPDAAIVDIGLPGMDGYEVARRLRATCPGPLRLVALTGYGHESDMRRSREAGFDAHVVKPASLGRIFAALTG